MVCVLQGRRCQSDSGRPRGAVHRREVKESREDRRTVIKRNRDPLCVRMALLVSHNPSRVHQTQRKDKPVTLLGEVILEIKYVSNHYLQYISHIIV